MSQTIKLLTPEQTLVFLNHPEKKLLDIRLLNDYQQCAIIYSTHVSEVNFSEVLNNLAFDEPIAVICYRGNSSKKFALYLLELGYQNVASVEGGMEEWVKQFPETLHSKS